MFNPDATGVGANRAVDGQATLRAHADGVAVKRLQRTFVPTPALKHSELELWIWASQDKSPS